MSGFYWFKRIGFLSFVFFASMFFLTQNCSAQSNGLYNEHEIVIKYKDGKIEKKNVSGNIFQEIYELQKNENILAVEPNFVYQKAALYNPNDLEYSKQTYLNQIKVEDAWKNTNGSSDVVIAIIDAGVDMKHPDLANKIWKNTGEIPDDGIDNDKNGFVDDVTGWDFVGYDNDPSPDFDYFYTDVGVSHGSLVAGISSAETDNAFGIAGVGWNTKIMVIRALDSMGEGDLDAIGMAINYAVAEGADVLNLSFVGYADSDILKQAIINAYKQGVVIVAAAGNTEDEENGQNLDISPLYPACYDYDGINMVIGVSSVSSSDTKSLFSNYGKSCVDVSSPGEDFFSTSPYNPEEGYDTYFSSGWSGTSLAAPLVSGTAALIKSINKDFTSDQIMDFILSSTDNIDELNLAYPQMLGTGRLNAGKAVQVAYDYNLSLAGEGIDAPAEVVIENNLVVVAPQKDSSPEIKVFDQNGTSLSSFYAYAETFNKGVNVAVGDLNNDGLLEIIAGAGYGGGPQVRIFDYTGNLISQFFAYDSKFRGGVKVSAGDINGDNFDEIITAPGLGGGPQVRIFDISGKVKGQFFAFDQSYHNGIDVSVGNLQGDSQDEIIVGLGSGQKPTVKIFDSKGILLKEFLGYAENYLNGINVSSANIDDTSYDEIILGTQSGGGPQIKIFDFSGTLINQFFAFDKNSRKGVNVGAGDIDDDGLFEIIAGGPSLLEPKVIAFDKLGHKKTEFDAFDKSFLGGVNVQ